MASMRVDLPLPFGPTRMVTGCVKSIRKGSAAMQGNEKGWLCRSTGSDSSSRMERK